MIVALVLLISSVLPGMGEEPYEYQGIRNIESLGGEVVDPSGAAVEGVTVEERTKGWKTVVRSTITVADGRVSFAPTHTGTYYLRFSKAGFHPVLIRVRIKKKAKPFRLQLDVAT